MARFAAVLGALVIFLAANAHAQSLSPRAFTETVAQSVRAKIPSAKVTITGDLKITIRYKDGTTSTSDLGSAYKLYDGKTDRLDLVIDTYVSALSRPSGAGAGSRTSDIPSRAPQGPAFVPAPVVTTFDRAQIIPLVKTQRWFEDTQRSLRAQGSELRHADNLLGGGLAIVYAQINNEGTRYVTTRDDVGDLAALPDLASANLKRVAGRIPVRAIDDDVSVMAGRANYAASLLLLNELWTDGRITVDGEFVAAVPTNDELLFTGSRNARGLARLREIATELAAEPDGLTPALFVYRGGKFVKFDHQ